MKERLEIALESGINDQIFRQLTLRGFSEKDGVRTWDIADSKLWYLTPEQARGFLAIENSPAYSAAITEKEVALLRTHLKTISRTLNRKPTNLIDLGCGDGAKAVLCIEDFMRETPVRYCPIDISAYMVQEATHAIESRGLAPVERIFWNISDFENLDNVAPLFRNKDFSTHCFLFLGNTLGNFDSKDILHGIRRGMEPGDVLVIGNGISFGQSEQEWIQTYTSTEIDDFCFKVLSQVGLSRDNVKFEVKFENGRVEMRYVILKATTVHNLGKSIVFVEGDVVRVAISDKYTEQDLNVMLREFFADVVIHSDQAKTYALAVCTI